MKYPIKRFTTSVIIANGQQVGTSAAAFDLNGILKGFFIVAPAMTQATFTLAIKDGNAPGGTLFTTASLAKAATHSIMVDSNNMPINLPLSGLTTLTVTSAGVEGADRTFSIVLLVER